MLQGIDISHWNGDIHWKDVKVDFSICKATQGKSYQDPSFFYNVVGAYSQDILIGAYHYLMGNVRVEEQADNFISTVNRLYRNKAISEQSCLLALDVEDGTLRDMSIENLGEICSCFINKCVYELGATPLVYVSDKAFSGLGNHLHKSLSVGGWIARYGKAGRDTEIERKDFILAIKQYSSKGQISGITGEVDLDVAFMSTEAWYKYAGYRGK